MPRNRLLNSVPSAPFPFHLPPPIRAMSENVLIKSATSILYYKIVISIIAFLISVVNGKKSSLDFMKN